MAVILLSGGLDSATNLALAAKEGRARLALTIAYGQRAERAEAEAARSLAVHYEVEWKEIDLRWLGAVNKTQLTQKGGMLPKLSIDELDSMDAATPSMKAVWVANRNGVFLNVAAAFAEAIGEDEVVAGFNLEEAATFPDNSQPFLDAITLSFSFSTLNKVKALSYTTRWDKTKILNAALELDLPLNYVWSCYEPGPDRCWECESCRRSERALRAQGKKGLEWLNKLGAMV